MDVDGSYLYKKQKSLLQSGVAVAPLDPPSPPLSGWEFVHEGNVQTVALKIPTITQGTYKCIYCCLAMYIDIT